MNYAYRWIDDTSGVTDGSKYDDLATHDMTAVWYTPWSGELAIGVRNITDEDPSFDSVSGWDNEASLKLYDVAGRTPFASYKHTF